MTKLFEAIVKALTKWLVPLGSIALIICALTWVLSNDSKTVQGAKSWFFRILIGLLIAFAANTIVTWVQSQAPNVDLSDLNIQ